MLHLASLLERIYYQGIPSDHISRWHIVEYSQCIFKAPTFCIHVNQAVPHKDIRVATRFNELFMNKPAVFMSQLIIRVCLIKNFCHHQNGFGSTFNCVTQSLWNLCNNPEPLQVPVQVTRVGSHFQNQNRDKMCL
jgi:hypothetical protein